ncbi:hypothetical protein D3C78_1798200 [compost metagenome]
MFSVDLIINVHHMLRILNSFSQHLCNVSLISFTCKNKCNIHRMIRWFRILQTLNQQFMKIGSTFIGNPINRLIRSILAADRLYRFDIGLLF